ncbi:3-isopropylmalate dehydratase large subunit [Streptomyces tagetis]|uniref:3-isopropylmalate dehydratase large subunit n=1 Tax=Streptomyces tagetis TaxID=2820809 RepID=A0A940XM19_9ACTN|nr:aconitase/3-isopropylmalate dehydratase large subunit family protein [Streptomyces sp. RG38]MBQ0827225.1 3-isopropylmalate dehydratase large subunit [Streptomyces sp. RG38]
MPDAFPQTIAEKVLTRQSRSGTPLRAGDTVDADIDGLLVVMYQYFRNAYKKIGFPDGPPTVWDPDKVFLMSEHVQPPPDLINAYTNLAARRDAERLGLPHFIDSEPGVCHQMMLDHGLVRPGELVVGCDSHTISYGGINAVSTGIGTDEAAYVWAFGTLPFTVPETVKVVLHGTTAPTGKDIILYLAGRYGETFAQGRALEFTGPLVERMDIATRLTIADHAVEVGAKFGVFPADDKTLEYVRARTDKPFTPVGADEGALYAQVIEIDCDAIGYQVAKPFRFDNVVPVAEVAGIRIDQARVGSCANGRLEDIAAVAEVMAGHRVAPGVRFYVSPASMTVYRQSVEAGHIAALLAAGVQVVDPGCSICQSPGIVLNEETCISSTTRNYRGRFGGSQTAQAQVYLATPAVVAASAIEGRIADPTPYLTRKETAHA